MANRRENPAICMSEDAISYIVRAESDMREFWARLRTIVTEKGGKLDNTDIEAFVRIGHNHEIANTMGKHGWQLYLAQNSNGREEGA